MAILQNTLEMGEQMDQDDFWAQFEPDEFLADDTIETRSEKPSTEPSQAFDDTRNVTSTPPNAFWTTILHPKLNKLLTRKFSNKSLSTDDTSVVVSVTDRTERNLHMHFDGVDIDWTVLEMQLQTWSHLLRIGKKLRMDISFNYIEPGGATTSARGGTKRKHPSATQDMLSQQTLDLDAEENATGSPPVWRHVYSLMRCPGPPCNLGPHCWIDNVGKKHYKLRTHHLESLIKHVQQGGTLQTHDDVPDEVREQLYAEEQQDGERQRKRRAPSSLASCPPINITNVLPAQSPQAPTPYPAGSQLESVGTTATKASNHLEIPEPLDIAVQRYTDWQCSRFSKKAVKMEYQKACDLTLAEGLDLELVYEDQNAEFFITNGVKSGVARRFVRDIETWVKKCGAQLQ
ncbi:hypothetical protein DL766_009127 [Monosporascus sp. MC13-8B]|uniref:Uncharacterized protein n=1 Tax=Monosporascus cannonballus TaxID=155416 RepID=A0ABY0HKW4_9PEZI|nr:hypothetical protein DL762_001386 [Monosporascus cannonballus]RYP01001.1 hypothetical protein DL763_000422 [Monosporascus cannonballus]RYP16411.1 hypothetical protein DL766_009127 [Monosporascus sp. MC13-8B]